MNQSQSLEYDENITEPKLLNNFLLRVKSFNETHSKRFLNECLQKFKQDCAFEIKILPNPEDVRLCYDSHFTKKFTQRKGWKSSKKTILLWIVFYYCLLMGTEPISFKIDLKQWEEVSEIIGILSPSQCKYGFLSMKKSNIQKSDWNPEEDQLLVEMIKSKKFGHNGKFKWTKIAQELNQNFNLEKNFRLAKHCRERFYNHLNPSLKKGDWTTEDDIILLKNYLKYHKKWSKINAKLKGRNDNIIKNRFYKLMKCNNLMDKNRKNFNDEKIRILINKLSNMIDLKNQDIEAKPKIFQETINEVAKPIIEINKPIITYVNNYDCEQKPTFYINNPQLNSNLYFQSQLTRLEQTKIIPMPVEETANFSAQSHIENHNEFLYNNDFISFEAENPNNQDNVLEKIFNEIQSINIYEQKSFKFVRKI